MKKRIIPILMLFENKLVITINFKKIIYIGDPINAVKIFNNFKADELIILDIGFRFNKPTDERIIFSMFDEAYMPVSFGGGVGILRNPQEIIKSGAERLILNSQLLLNEPYIYSLINKFGSQSIVGSIDLYFDSYKKEYCLHSAHTNKGSSFKEIISKIDKFNLGELIINFVENDGTFGGLRNDFYYEITKLFNTPIVSCGGAKSIQDMVQSIKLGRCNASAAGALFVFRNNNLNSVMINYPNQEELIAAFKNQQPYD